MSAALIVPTGSATNASASAAGTTAERQPRPTLATRASARAKTKKVRCVPSNGISSRAEIIVPSSEPAVEIAYSRPTTSPERSTSPTASRTAHGAAAPSSVTGTATRTSTPNSEPAKPPTETVSKASTEKPRKGRAAKGTSAISSEAARTSRQRPRRCGWRSA